MRIMYDSPRFEKLCFTFKTALYTLTSLFYWSCDRNTRSHDHCLLSVKPLPHDPQISVSLPPSLWCSCNHLHRGGGENGDTGDTGESGEMCDSSEEAVKNSSCRQSQGEEGVAEVGVVSTPHVHITSGRSLGVTVAIRAK